MAPFAESMLCTCILFSQTKCLWSAVIDITLIGYCLTLQFVPEMIEC